jgi:acylphosphatase
VTGQGRDADYGLESGTDAAQAAGRTGATATDRAAWGDDPRKPSGSGSGNVRLTAWVEGRVQGVGFRWWVRSRALALGLAGEAENLADGRVKVIAEGPTGVCEEMLGLLQAGGTPGRVRRVTSRWAPASGGFSGFTER